MQFEAPQSETRDEGAVRSSVTLCADELAAITLLASVSMVVTSLLTAAGAGLDRLGGGPKLLAISAGLMGLQTVAVENLIQVVYPV